MTLFPALEEAVYLRRLNRFILECFHNDKIIKVYMPNPGRLWELLFEGAKILLTPGSPGSKYPYIVCAVKKADQFIPLHTHKTNALVEELINKQLIRELEGYTVVKREVSYKKSRFDFLLSKDGEELYLEVKTCSLFHKRVAMFPDAVSARAKKHLLELSELADEGVKGAVLFVVQSDRQEWFLPDYHTDIEFSRALLAVRKRVTVIALGITVDSSLTVSPELKSMRIPWEIAEREANDSGCYFIILKLEEDKELEVGGLKTISFKKGYYLYTGSAKRGLAKRTARHSRVRKRKHWHIDYLREHAQFIKALPIRTTGDIECALAAGAAGLSDWQIDRFGASDCDCSSHLFGFSNSPLERREFIELLLDYRMDSILN